MRKMTQLKLNQWILQIAQLLSGREVIFSVIWTWLHPAPPNFSRIYFKIIMQTKIDYFVCDETILAFMKFKWFKLKGCAYLQPVTLFSCLLSLLRVVPNSEHVPELYVINGY